MRARRRTGHSIMRVAATLATAAVLLLPGGAALAADRDPIVGAWQATLDADGDKVPAGLLFTSDGSVLVTSPDGLDGAAVGSWRHTGTQYAATIMVHLPDSDGVVVMEVVAAIVVDGTLSGTGSATLTPDGGEPETRSFALTAIPITVEGPATPEASIASAAGGGPDAIAAAIAAFKDGFGADNLGEPGSFGQGFRSITWDKVPAEQSAPETYAPDFFNGPDSPRARGVVFAGSAGGLMVSAGKPAPDASLRFGSINRSYAETFQAFSEQKLFAPLGTNVLELSFFQPGTATPAVVRGFGAVFADVDLGGATTVELLGTDGGTLGTFPVEAADGGLSFLGVTFDDAIVAGVRITLGTSPLGPTDGPTTDVVVLDDLVYAEPQRVS